MPVYEYECRKCGDHLEVTQKMSDPALAECGKCGGSLKKLITATSFVLKGSGWYATDYPSADRKKASEECKTSCPAKETKTGAACPGTGCKKAEALKA